MSRALRFTEGDVARALKAVKAAGVPVGRVEIEADGKIVIVSRGPYDDADLRRESAKGALEALRARLKAEGARPPSRRRVGAAATARPGTTGGERHG